MAQRRGGKRCSPATAAGAGASLVLPLPTLPVSLAPQQYALSSAATPQALLNPTLRVTKVISGAIGTGRGAHDCVPKWPVHVAVGFGIDPCAADPQQCTFPSAVTPHVQL